jgi:hypothetical protein
MRWVGISASAATRVADVRVKLPVSHDGAPPPEVQQLFGAIWGSQGAMDGFVQVNAETDLTGAILLARERLCDQGRGRPRRPADHQPVVAK